MRSQATRYTSKQLAYLAHWEAHGYTFGRDDKIPEDTRIAPRQWYMPCWVDLNATAVLLAAIGVCLYAIH